MLLGHWIEMNAVMNAGSALNELAELLPSQAHRIDEKGQVTDVKLQDVTEGDRLLVRGGEKIPADGKVVDGESAVNEAMVTGESKLVQKKVDTKVFGGSVNGDGTIQIEVTGTGENSFLAQVTKMVESAQNEKSGRENLADKVASWLFYVALTIAVISFIAWWLTTDLATALPRAVTVLIIACPHALGLAIPLVVARSTSIGAKQGLLLRDRNAMEQVTSLKYALMDKTGTLTEGNFKVKEYGSLSTKKSDAEVLKTMASLEAGSSHPLAVGITKKARAEKIGYKSVNSSQIKGVGLKGEIDGTNYLIVSPGYVEEKGLSVDNERFDALASEGNSLSFLVENDKVVGFVAQGDQIKPAAKKLIDTLLSQGITPVMLTGDNKQAAKGVAEKLGITEFKAQLLPADKEKAVQSYQNDGKVMMIGDGVNDAPSLARADIGVAIGSGTDVAIESADLVLVKSDPHDIINFLELSRKTTSKMTQNLWWGAGYNIIALPLAAGVLAPVGFVLSPMVGAVLMSLSTVIVAINALTLKI
jgi:copper-(or silver)-translocating P-type ATPase